MLIISEILRRVQSTIPAVEGSEILVEIIAGMVYEAWKLDFKIFP